LQDVDLESGIMTFVAEGLGVTLAREQIKKIASFRRGFSSTGVASEGGLLDWVAP